LAGAAAAGIAAARLTTLAAANQFLREHYIAEFNAHFQVPAQQRGSAFIAARRKELDLILSLQYEPTVNRDNTVNFQNLVLQIEPVASHAGGRLGDRPSAFGWNHQPDAWSAAPWALHRARYRNRYKTNGGARKAVEKTPTASAAAGD
jgi:hypothetical protein